MTDTIASTIEALKLNKMEASFVETREEALKKALSYIKPHDTVSVGGSVTLKEIGILDALSKGNYNYLDRYSVSGDMVDKLFREVFTADAFFTSSNAVTQNGELFNVDGNANRIAAMLFGPKNVIVIVGKNKIVKDIDEAIVRLKTIAAPKNAIRLKKNTYCAKTGHCIALDSHHQCDIAYGCRSEDRICRDYVIMAEQGIKNRVKVIIVNEDLGY